MPADPLLVRGKLYFLDARDSDTLWVILSARGMVEGRFMFFQRSAVLPGARLLLRTPREDFYQGMFEDAAELIRKTCAELGIRRTLYAGFSAGAFGALVLGLRDPLCARILSFAPQFRLDHPLTVADRTVLAPGPGLPRFDPRYNDIREPLQKIGVWTDIFVGTYDISDGISVKDSLAFKLNPHIRLHHVRWGHDVAAGIDKNGALDAIFAGAAKGAEASLPEKLRATEQEVRLAIRSYELGKAMQVDNLTVPVPDEDDAGCLSASWWNMKSRVRFKNGDIYGAITDISRALTLQPDSDGHYVVAGHYFKALGLLDVAASLYTKATTMSIESWGGQLGLATVRMEQKQWQEAEAAIGVAILRGAPRASTDPVLRGIRHGRAPLT